MTGSSRDPLEGIDRLLVDGNNLLHALRRAPTPLPSAAIVGRLRAVVPAEVRIELVFDGPPEPGSRGRIASGVTLRYSGGRSADAVLVNLVESAGPPMPGYEPTILVCTDDAELRRALHARGAATVRTDWLIGRIGRTKLSAPSVGAARPPKAPAQAKAPAGGRSAARTTAATGEDDEERPGWQPGRGATRKKGNARRQPKAGRREKPRHAGPDC